MEDRGTDGLTGRSGNIFETQDPGIHQRLKSISPSGSIPCIRIFW